MQVLVDKCIGCLRCIDYCSVGAIHKVPDERLVGVDEEECVECGICLRSKCCPVEALEQPELQWPRTLRAEFSDPTITHPSTGVGGRGTEEMKTNDVTGRYPRGFVGMAVEMGRPSIGARFYDLEKVQMALAKLGVHFEEANPVQHLVTNKKTGKLRKDVLNEKVLSAIIEFGTTPEKVPAVLDTLRQVSQEIDCVFSLDLCSLVEQDGSQPVADIARQAGATLRPNGKTNMGLGRPSFQFFREGK
jgi:NAD-dependent dihydropyrimidine dehydrogenase PreA subunit